MGTDLDGVHPKLGSKGSDIATGNSDLAVRLDVGSLYIHIYLLMGNGLIHTLRRDRNMAGIESTTFVSILTALEEKPKVSSQPSCHDVTICICPPDVCGDFKK